MAVGDFSPHVLTKAEKVIERERLRQDPEHPAIWWVRASEGTREYRVQTDITAERTISWVTCTCPHGLNKGAGQAFCYHVAAVLITLKNREEIVEVKPS